MNITMNPTQYRWTWRDDRGAMAVVVDGNRLDAETRAFDLLCADRVELVLVEEVTA